MRFVVTTLLVAIMAACVCMSASAESSATLDWEVEAIAGTGVTVRCLAVDQSFGFIYVMGGQATCKKYDSGGNLMMTIGSALKDSTGTTKATIASPNPTGLAVDPLTGYLYLAGNNSALRKHIHVLDCSGSSAVWLREADPGLSGAVHNLAFSDDGQKLYAFGMNTTATGDIDIGGKELIRNDAGTPGDATDDYFTLSGVVLDTNSQGTMLALNHADVRGGTVDRLGNIYITDLHGTKRPIKRLRPGSSNLELEFYGYTKKSWGCSTDAANNFWMCDINAADSPGQMVRCYSSGIEVFAFDPAGEGTSGQMVMPRMVACDRLNGRIIVAGDNALADATKGLLQCWTVSVDTPPMGTITGRVVDANTSAPVTSVSAISIYSPYYYPTSYGVTFYGLSSPGTYSYPVKPGLYNVRAFSNGYISAARSHYDVQAGGTTTVPDIPLLSTDSPFVTIQLGEHNLEQGLFLRSTVPGAYTAEGATGTANFAANKAGRECRGFGRPENNLDERYLNIDVDESFITGGIPQHEAWIEVDYFDDGPDILGAEIKTKDPSVSGSPAVVADWFAILKEGTNTWKKQLSFRPDIYFDNLISGSCDFRFDSLCKDGARPAGPDFISQVTVRKSPTENSYTPISSIGSVKQIITGDLDSGKAAGGTAVKLTDQVISAVFADKGCFYIQDKNNFTGIRVNYDFSTMYFLAPGNVVDITGALMTLAGNQELVINTRAQDPEAVVYKDSVPAPDPVYLIGKSVSAGALWMEKLVNSVPYLIPVQPGVTGSSGLSTVALLSKTFGKVAHVWSNMGGEYFAYIDDGSGMKSESLDSATSQVGIKLIGNGVSDLQIGQYIQVTGIPTLGYQPMVTPSIPAAYYYPTMLVTNIQQITTQQ